MIMQRFFYSRSHLIITTLVVSASIFYMLTSARSLDENIISLSNRVDLLMADDSFVHINKFIPYLETHGSEPKNLVETSDETRVNQENPLGANPRIEYSNLLNQIDPAARVVEFWTLSNSNYHKLSNNRKDSIKFDSIEHKYWFSMLLFSAIKNVDLQLPESTNMKVDTSCTFVFINTNSLPLTKEPPPDKEMNIKEVLIDGRPTEIVSVLKTMDNSKYILIKYLPYSLMKPSTQVVVVTFIENDSKPASQIYHNHRIEIIKKPMTRDFVYAFLAN